MNPVVHFEMPTKDKARVSKFYAQVFGWEMKTMNEEYGGYVLASTTETDENQMVKTPGNINGGFYQIADDKPLPPPHVVISVDHLEESIKDVKEAGGQILGEPMDIPQIGTFASIKDTEGNVVGLLQPAQM